MKIWELVIRIPFLQPHKKGSAEGFIKPSGGRTFEIKLFQLFDPGWIIYVEDG